MSAPEAHKYTRRGRGAGAARRVDEPAVSRFACRGKPRVFALLASSVFVLNAGSRDRGDRQRKNCATRIPSFPRRLTGSPLFLPDRSLRAAVRCKWIRFLCYALTTFSCRSTFSEGSAAVVVPSERVQSPCALYEASVAVEYTLRGFSRLDVSF